MAKVVRAVIECGVPDFVTEKRLVWKLRDIFKYPIQLGDMGDRETLAKPEVKAFSRISPYHRQSEEPTGDFTELSQLLKQALNQPLPGGRGFQSARDRHIANLAGQLYRADLPER